MKKKVSAYWRSWKGLWIKYRIAKGKKDIKSMHEIEKDLIKTADKLDIERPVFLIMEANKIAKRK